MENTQEQKTPEQWFQLLREPYRSEAIKWIDVNSILYKEKVNSLDEAVYCIDFTKYNKCAAIYVSLKAGETTYLEPETLKPEPIELRPIDLVSGEVYTMINTEYDRRFTFIHKHYDADSANPILYTKMYAHHLKEFHYNSCFSLRLIKIYHATPEEKKLLLGEEEPTNWEAKYNELKSNYELAKNEIEIEKDLREQWHNHYFKLKEEYNGLKAKYDQLEKGEKVYFYFNENKGHITYTEKLEVALNLSPQDNEIYEAVCIGKKKSVLVNETT